MCYIKKKIFITKQYIVNIENKLLTDISKICYKDENFVNINNVLSKPIEKNDAKTTNIEHKNLTANIEKTVYTNYDKEGFCKSLITLLERHGLNKIFEYKLVDNMTDEQLYRTESINNEYPLARNK